MSEYDFRPGGSLKLKGGVADGGIVKKKKKSKSKSKDKERDVGEEARLKELEKVMREEEAKSGSSSGSNRESPAAVSSSSSVHDKKTAAEKRFEEVQKRRLAEKVARLVGKTHKDRVNEFNSKLEALSEHHDIPKVGPG
ncbi:Protein FAM32A [Abortiporus biennis]